LSNLLTKSINAFLAQSTRSWYPLRVRVNRRGLTLPELMIGMSILSVIMTLCYSVMHTAGLQVKRAASDTATQKATLVTLQKMVGEATYSDHRSLTVTEGAFSYLSPRPVDAATASSLGPGELVAVDAYSETTWPKFMLFYYEPDKQRVMSKEFVYTGGQALARIRDDKFPSLISVGLHPAKRVADQVTSFQAHRTGLKTFYLEISATQQKGGQEQATNLSMTFTCRNGL
jgi:prepilin-type N-terminal cleavage/methylation domain-containing protein